jgi:hypothetical protein
MRFDSFELRALDGRTVVRDRKSGFCLADHWGAAPGSDPGRHPVFLGDCEQYHPDATQVTMGTSPGLHRPVSRVLPRPERRRDGRPRRRLRPDASRQRGDAAPRAPLRERRRVRAPAADVAERHAERAGTTLVPGFSALLASARSEPGRARRPERARRSHRRR